MKTYAVKAGEIERNWHLVDAEGQTLGRLASVIATILRGKHKPIFSPHLDTGDHVVVVNAEKVRVTGAKMAQKTYYRHSGYPGGLKSETLVDALKKHPERVIERAVRGMLPHNALGKQTRTKLKVYAGPHHPHAAQQPVDLKLSLGQRSEE
jgi:large subunit ribosomal protein L13